MIDSADVSITSCLISELIKNKIKIIFCDEKRNPVGETNAYNICFNSSKKIRKQVKWNDFFAKELWTYVIKQKIINQSQLLKKLKLSNHRKLLSYAYEIEYFDETNREGHAAKVYFNTLFGKDFSRNDDNDINAALNYGYSILLSNFNKEIVSMGYITQLGIKHINEYNPYNLSCDLMEPFRILIDEIVYNNIGKKFDFDYKILLVNVLNTKVYMDGKEYYLTNAIQMYLKGVFTSLDNCDYDKMLMYEFV